MNKYENVADNCGLVGITKERYIKYMTIRWSDTEKQKCQDGYAVEWAERFRMRDEYNCSDDFGKSVLQNIYSIEIDEQDGIIMFAVDSLGGNYCLVTDEYVYEYNMGDVIKVDRDEYEMENSFEYIKEMPMKIKRALEVAYASNL